MAKQYVDGYVLVIPKKNFNEYKKMATEASKIWKKYGALEYFECVGDDLKPNMGSTQTLTFPKLTQLKKNEDIWFSFIIYKNKKERNTINKKVMDYFTKKYPKNDMPMPFDMKRISYAGFKTVVEETK
ncbi:MAG: DUF1428 domain-containing protein [archaeon]